MCERDLCDLYLVCDREKEKNPNMHRHVAARRPVCVCEHDLFMLYVCVCNRQAQTCRCLYVCVNMPGLARRRRVYGGRGVGGRVGMLGEEVGGNMRM